MYGCANTCKYYLIMFKYVSFWDTVCIEEWLACTMNVNTDFQIPATIVR